MNVDPPKETGNAIVDTLNQIAHNYIIEADDFKTRAQAAGHTAELQKELSILGLHLSAHATVFQKTAIYISRKLGLET